MEGVSEWPTGWLWQEGDWEGLSSSTSTSLALKPLGAWFSESAAGVTTFDTSVASREHSGCSANLFCCPTVTFCSALRGKSCWSCQPHTSNYSPDSSSSQVPAEKSFSWSHSCALLCHGDGHTSHSDSKTLSDEMRFTRVKKLQLTQGAWTQTEEHFLTSTQDRLCSLHRPSAFHPRDCQPNSRPWKLTHHLSSRVFLNRGLAGGFANFMQVAQLLQTDLLHKGHMGQSLSFCMGSTSLGLQY